MILLKAKLSCTDLDSAASLTKIGNDVLTAGKFAVYNRLSIEPSAIPHEIEIG